MRKLCFLFGVLLSCGVYALEAVPETLQLLRKDHPRIFITKENICEIKHRISGTAKKSFARIKGEVDNYPENPEWDFKPERFTYVKNGKSLFKRPYFMLTQVMTVGGRQAQNAAFVYLMTNEKIYLEKAKKYLIYCTTLFEWALGNEILVDWQNNHYERAIIAYDWLYNDLSQAERTRFAKSLLMVVNEIQRDGKAKFRRNCGGVETGYYGTERLMFYTGAAIYGDGIDDKLAATHLMRGIRGFNGVLEHREKMSGGYGALVHYCLGYTFLEYPLAPLRYFFAVKSAFNVNEAEKWNHMKKFPLFVALNWLPDKNNVPLEFGLGDAHHTDNAIPIKTMMNVMRSIAHLYPESKELALTVARKLPYRARIERDDFGDFFLEPFKFKSNVSFPPIPKFCYVPTIGVAYFRSGSGKNDTYACFRAGNETRNHSHYDQNHFVIYKNGFQAIDSGTRGRNQSFHLPYYYAQTVAHNAMLIDMKNEEIGKHFGPDHHGYKSEKPFMDGGQYKKVINAKVQTQESEDYASVLCDATEAYRPEKCKLAEREFIHIRNDLFLVIDRVESTQSSYRKRWLLHTQNKIELNGNSYTSSEQDGELTGMLLYPSDGKIEVIGGKGREFWTNGKNWELHPKFDKTYIGKLHGNWRVEITPAKQNCYDIFINLIQVSAKGQNAEKIAPQVLETCDKIIVKFSYSGKIWNVNIPKSRGNLSEIKVK